jgi:hypothetical protein
MDISVSRLNGRLAQKLPPELPLGLVFVVGEVAELGSRVFVLIEGSHRLSCRVAEEVTAVAVGDEVRASGHLMFDDQRLQYYLRVGDIERVTQEPLGQLDSDSRELLTANDGLLSALEAVKARAAVAPAGGEGTLPIWVKKLAPPEAKVDVAQDDEVAQSGHERLLQGELDAGLVTLLSEAMDSEEEMELTSELLAPYLPTEPEHVGNEDVDSVVEEGKTAVSLANLSSSYRPPNQQDTDWLVILLLISFFVLMIAVVVAIILLLIR